MCPSLQKMRSHCLVPNVSSSMQTCTPTWSPPGKKFDSHSNGLQDEIVGAARAHPDTDVFQVSKGLREQAAVDLMAVDVDEGTAGPTGDDVTNDPTAAAAEALAQTANPDRDLHSFEIIPEKVGAYFATTGGNYCTALAIVMSRPTGCGNWHLPSCEHP